MRGLRNFLVPAGAQRGAPTAGPHSPSRFDLTCVPGALPRDRAAPAHRPGRLQRGVGEGLTGKGIRGMITAPGLGDPVGGPAPALAARHLPNMRHEHDEQPTDTPHHSKFPGA